MYHVHAKEQGDAQPGVFHRQLLHVAYLGYSFQVEKASDEPALNLLGNIAVLACPVVISPVTGRFSWPIFSSTVIRFISASIKRSMS